MGKRSCLVKLIATFAAAQRCSIEDIIIVASAQADYTYDAGAGSDASYTITPFTLETTLGIASTCDAREITYKLVSSTPADVVFEMVSTADVEWFATSTFTPDTTYTVTFQGDYVQEGRTTSISA